MGRDLVPVVVTGRPRPWPLPAEEVQAQMERGLSLAEVLTWCSARYDYHPFLLRVSLTARRN
jgi:hypothetical protein